MICIMYCVMCDITYFYFTFDIDIDNLNLNVNFMKIC